MSTKGSCATEDVSEGEAGIDIQDQCELYVDDDPLHLVAISKVYNLWPTIHHKSIEDDKVRVVVEQVRDVNARVPMPIEEVQIVKQVLNHFILWLRRLVKPISVKDIDGSNKVVSPKRYLHRLCISKGNIHLYGFIDLLSLQSIRNKAKEVQAYL